MVRASPPSAWGFALLLSASAAAQTAPDEAPRRELIAQATQARDDGAPRLALERARRAAALRSSPSLSLLIAELDETLGETLPALAEARRCEAALEGDRAHRDWQRYFDSCHALVIALEARVGRLNAVAPEAPAAPASTTPTAVASPAAPVVAARPRLTARSVGAGAAPWVVVGVGAASLVVSGVFFALRGAALSDRDAACGTSTGVCALGTDASFAAATRAQSDAHTFNALTNVSLGVGAAALAGGVLWWALARSTHVTRADRVLVIGASGDGAFVGLHGAL